MTRWDELNTISKQFVTYDKTVDEAVKDFEDILIDSYLEGYAAAAYMLGNDSSEESVPAPDKSVVSKVVDKRYPISETESDETKTSASESENSANKTEKSSEDGIKTESIIEKFIQYYAARENEKLTRLLESEFHRSNEMGGFDAASSVANAIGGVYKVWSSILDNRTRDTHFILDGTRVPVGDRFYSISGDSAYYPGGFETAEENAGCRCTVLYSRG